MRSTEAGPGPAGKIVRGVVGATVAVAVTAGATYAMGLWQFGDTPEAAAGAAVRPLRAPVAVSGKTVTVLGAGSILPSPEVWDQARRDGGGTIDFARVLAGARTAAASADLALCHLSVPVAPAAGPYAGAPRYNVPPQIAQAIAKTGFDGCATAAERAFDQGSPGLARTLDALDKAKVGHAGTYRDEESAERTKLYTVDGVKVAHLSYTSGLAGLKLPAGREWAVAFASEDRVEEDARQAREAGAAIVVVSIDWGSEGEQEPDADQQTLARAIATMRDVDLVLGHGAHTVQPIERLDGKWIVYGLGDLASRSAQPVNENREGAMIRVTFSPGEDEGRWKVAAVEAIPTFVDLNPDIRTVDLEQALADPSLSAGRRQIYAAAVDRIKGQLLTRGAGDAKVVIRGTQS